MPRYTVHPWRTRADLLAVCSQLHDTRSPDAQRHAATRILSCWKLRGNLPHAVESTALLVDAQLHHSHNPDISQFAVRAVYAAAFTRFVTGFCDIGRARENSLQPSSMLDVARRIGMPTDFVALRHEATHEEMPSLPRLVEAVGRGVAWLWEVYWSRLDDGEARKGGEGGAGNERSLDEVKVELRRVLKGFRSLRRDAFRTRRQGKAEHSTEIETAARSCYDLCVADESRRMTQAKVGALAEVLVEERFLFPSGRRQVNLFDLLLHLYRKLTAGTTSLGESMDGAYTLWDPLLRSIARLDSRHFIAALVKRLQAQLAESEQSSRDSRCEAVALWLLHVHEYASPTYERLEVGTLRTCCLYPGHWTRMVGERLLNRDQELNDEWRNMFEASMLADGDRMDVDGQSVKAATESSAFATKPDALDGSGGFAGGWRRAPLPPRVPIGVVG